jgi:hypothetical protein
MDFDALINKHSLGDNVNYVSNLYATEASHPLTRKSAAVSKSSDTRSNSLNLAGSLCHKSMNWRLLTR